MTNEKKSNRSARQGVCTAIAVMVEWRTGSQSSGGIGMWSHAGWCLSRLRVGMVCGAECFFPF